MRNWYIGCVPIRELVFLNDQKLFCWCAEVMYTMCSVRNCYSYATAAAMLQRMHLEQSLYQLFWLHRCCYLLKKWEKKWRNKYLTTLNGEFSNQVVWIIQFKFKVLNVHTPLHKCLSMTSSTTGTPYLKYKGFRFKTQLMPVITRHNCDCQLMPQARLCGDPLVTIQ